MPSRLRKTKVEYPGITLPETFLLQINQEQELLPLLQLIEKEAGRQLKAEGISIFLLDREEGELWFPLPVSGKVHPFIR